MASYWIIKSAQRMREADTQKKLDDDNNALKQALAKEKLNKQPKELSFFDWLRTLKKKK